jgi:hypothetical protein
MVFRFYTGRMKNYLLIVACYLLLVAGCAPGEMVGTGYLVTVEHGIQTKWERLENTAQVDSFVFAKTGIALQADNLIVPEYPFYQFRNGEFNIYVEMQGIYQRQENGKRRWRVYDEELESSKFNVQSLKFKE